MISPIFNVQDVDASVTFYTEKLGFKHSFSLPGPDGRNAFAFVSLGDAINIGLNLDDNVGAQGVDFMLYVPEGSTVDALYDDIQGRSVPIAVDIDTRYWGDRTFSVRDPDNYLLTFAQTVQQTDMNEVAAMMRGGEAPSTVTE